MAIENTSLIAEVDAISKAGDYKVDRKLTAEILANNVKLRILKVLNMSIRRSYISNFADETFIEVLMGSGQYAHRVYPYKSNLMITIYSEPVGGVGKVRIADATIKSEQFRAMVTQVNSATLEGNEEIDVSPEMMDTNNIKRVRLQLIDVGVEQLRLLTAGTIPQNTPPGDSLKLLLTEVSKQINVENESAFKGVQMVEPTNKEPFKQLALDHGTPLYDLGEMIQNGAGIYSTGYGNYFQDGYWYVYPLYDYERFDRELKTLTLINVPRRRYEGIERTFRKTANQTIALVTGEVTSLDLSDRRLMNEGNGVRFTDPDRAFKSYGVAEGNKATVMREEMNNELVTKESATGFNRTPVSNSRFTTNKMVQLSQLAARDGSLVACSWDYSDMNAIYPGMPVKFMYESKGSVVETQGVVWEAIHTFESFQQGAIPSSHRGSTALLLFVNVVLDSEPAPQG